MFADIINYALNLLSNFNGWHKKPCILIKFSFTPHSTRHTIRFKGKIAFKIDFPNALHQIIKIHSSEKWRNIPAWSAALEAACKQNGILFANCDSLAADYPNLWDPDGIHFREAFYPHWASVLVITTLMEET